MEFISSLRSRSTTATSHLRRRFHRHWYLLLVTQTTLLEAIIALPNVIGGRPDLNHDAMLYLFTGWYWTQGGVPYLHVWDWKPPSNPVFTAVISFLAGGNPSRIAVLSILTTVAAAIGIVALVGALVYNHTGDTVAAYSAGTVMLTFGAFIRLAAQGFRPKYFLLLFGLAAIYLLVHGRYAQSGACAAAAAGFWQFGIVFPVIVVIGVYRGDGHSPDEGGGSDRRRRIGRTVTGMAGATALIILPVVLSGATIPMVTQAVLGPLGTGEPFLPIQRLTNVKTWFGRALPVMAIGVAGAFIGWRKAWWVPVGAGWALLQVGVLDLTYYADLFLLAAFCALGYGLLVHRTNEHIVPLLLVIVIAALVISQFAVGEGSLIVQSQPVPADGSWEYERGTADWYYWTQPLPDTCHIWRSSDEQQLTRALGGSFSDTECQYGVWRWMRAVFG